MLLEVESKITEERRPRQLIRRKKIRYELEFQAAKTLTEVTRQRWLCSCV